MATTGANGGGVSKQLLVYTGRAQTAAESLLPATRLYLCRRHLQSSGRMRLQIVEKAFGFEQFCV